MSVVGGGRRVLSTSRAGRNPSSRSSCSRRAWETASNAASAAAPPCTRASLTSRARSAGRSQAALRSAALSSRPDKESFRTRRSSGRKPAELPGSICVHPPRRSSVSLLLSPRAIICAPSPLTRLKLKSRTVSDPSPIEAIAASSSASEPLSRSAHSRLPDGTLVQLLGSEHRSAAAAASSALPVRSRSVRSGRRSSGRAPSASRARAQSMRRSRRSEAMQHSCAMPPAPRDVQACTLKSSRLCLKEHKHAKCPAPT